VPRGRGLWQGEIFGSALLQPARSVCVSERFFSTRVLSLLFGHVHIVLLIVLFIRFGYYSNKHLLTYIIFFHTTSTVWLDG